MVRREFKHQLLRNFELALYSERIQRLRKNKKNFLVVTARYIYRAAGATLRSSVVVLLGFYLVMLAYGCTIRSGPQCIYKIELHYLNSEIDTINYVGYCNPEPYINPMQGYNLDPGGWDGYIAKGVNRFKILEKNTIIVK